VTKITRKPWIGESMAVGVRFVERDPAPQGYPVAVVGAQPEKQ
jgi:hypothetical protein